VASEVRPRLIGCAVLPRPPQAVRAAFLSLTFSSNSSLSSPTPQRVTLEAAIEARRHNRVMMLCEEADASVSPAAITAGKSPRCPPTVALTWNSCFSRFLAKVSQRHDNPNRCGLLSNITAAPEDRHLSAAASSSES